MKICEAIIGLFKYSYSLPQWPLCRNSREKQVISLLIYYSHCTFIFVQQISKYLSTFWKKENGDMWSEEILRSNSVFPSGISYQIFQYIKQTVNSDSVQFVAEL